LDVSTAFLKGWSFDDMKDSGLERQDVALVLPPDTWRLQSKLAPTNKLFKEASTDPKSFCLTLTKSVYGLKDAPLLWALRLFTTLRKLGLKQTAHDGCLWLKYDRNNKTTLLLSIHVDDTLLSGRQDEMVALHKALEADFGTMKREVDSFKHFGVHIRRQNHDVFMCQSEYIKTLRPISVLRKKGDGRTADTKCSPTEVSDFRSLVSGIAWLGVTHPGAQAAASLFQSYLPEPLIKHSQEVNNFLEQISVEYRPIVFRSDIDLANCREVVVTDSSLGNNTKYSQGGHLILLANKTEEHLCGSCTMFTGRSAKSKRVANSTMCAETLALLQGVEEGMLIQSWIYELMHPQATALEILKIPPVELPEIIACTDCEDLHQVLIKPAAPAPTNKSMVLHLSALRNASELLHVRQWVWIDTNDNPSNPLTKLEASGCLPLEILTNLLEKAFWEPTKPYKWGSQYVKPVRQQNAHSKTKARL